MRQALLQFNEEVLNVERLMALQSILPTEEERKSFNSYKGDIGVLAPVEQFLFKLFNIPYLEMRLEFFILMQQFPSSIAELSVVSQAYIMATRGIHG